MNKFGGIALAIALPSCTRLIPFWLTEGLARRRGPGLNAGVGRSRNRPARLGRRRSGVVYRHGSSALLHCKCTAPSTPRNFMPSDAYRDEAPIAGNKPSTVTLTRPQLHRLLSFQPYANRVSR